MKPVVVAAEMVSPYGKGTDACWNGLLDGRSALSRVERFRTGAFQSGYAGIIGGLRYHEQASLVMQMLQMLLEGAVFPEDAMLLLATTKGEIDLLEENLLHGRGDASDALITRLLGKVLQLTGTRGGGMALSAACTSSAAAVAQAAALIRNGHADCVLVVACDGVTEFIFSGFSSLMAMDRKPARPFDKRREGLNVGEAAAYALLMSDARAAREGRPVLGTIEGFGLSDDANHMTGPSRESEGLVLAVTKALASAGAGPDDIGLIAAHGTGTVYNDQMEMRAFHRVFRNGPVPVYSVKGGIGHTMGAAGLVETIVAFRALRERMVPPTVNLKEPDDDARGWVADAKRTLAGSAKALVTNAGFSGVNTALVLA